MTQTLYLPEGYYALSATGRCSGNATLTLTVNGDTIGFPPEGNSGGNIHAYAGENSAEAGTNTGKGYGWNRRHLAFHLAENTACTLKVEASADTPEQWFSIDGFTLSYAAAKGTAKAEDGRITASGIIEAEDLALLAGEDETLCVAVLQMIEHLRELSAQEAGDDGWRCLVGAQTVRVGRARDAGLQQGIVRINGLQYVDDEGDEAEVILGCLARAHQQDAGVGTERPVVVLTRAVDALEWFLVQQDTEAVLARDLPHQGHDKQVVVVGQVTLL